MADPTDVQPEQAPTINESAGYAETPPVDTKSIYANEFGALIAPKNTWDTIQENMRLTRHLSPLNSWGDAEDGLGGGVLVRQAALYGLPGMRDLGLDQQLTDAGQKKLSLEDTRKILPYATEPMHEQIAMALAEDKRIVDGRKSYAARGGDLWAPIHWGMGLYAGITEPWNIPLAIGAGGGMAALGIKESIRSVFLSNVLQNLGLEAATYPQLKREGEDVTPSSVVVNSLVGGAVGTGLHFGAKFLKNKLFPENPAEGAKKPPNQPMPPTPPDVENTRFVVGIAQHESGQAINPGRLGDQIIRIRREGRPPAPNAIAHYIFRPLDDTADRSFFVSGGEHHTNALTGLGGDSIELSDNGNYQNMWGDVAEVKLSKLNLLDIDQRATALPDVLSTIKDVLERRLVPVTDERGVTTPGGKVSFPLEASLRDILENVKHQMPEALTEIKSQLKDQGIDGYKYVDADRNGDPVHNGLVLFDDAKTEIVKSYEQNRDMVPQLSQDDIHSALDNPNKTETSPYYEAGVTDAQPQKLLTGPTYTEEPVIFEEKIANDIRAQTAADERAIKQLIESDPEKYGHLTEGLQEIQDGYNEDVKQGKLLRMLGDCTNRGL